MVAVAVLAAATGVGLFWRTRQGRLRPVPGARPPGGGASLLLFTTPTCGNCHAVRSVSKAVAAAVPGVEFHEVDATVDPDRARDLKVWRAPTLFVLDAAGAPVWRATGVPRRDDLAAAVRAAVC
jgi:hypothetical protein